MTILNIIYYKINSGFKERVICDYIAGMTDRFAQLEYTKIFNERS